MLLRTPHMSAQGVYGGCTQGALAYVEGDGMHTGVDIAQGPLDRAVPCNPPHLSKGLCADHNAKMAFPRAIIARMPCMFVAFVHDFQLLRGKGCDQPCFYFVLHRHFSDIPLQSAGQSPKL